MRSIVGTGPGGFRAMRYRNGPVVRPLLDASRNDLRAYLVERERAEEPVAVDAEGSLWREDATNATRTGSAPTCATRSCPGPRSATRSCSTFCAAA